MRTKIVNKSVNENDERIHSNFRIYEVYLKYPYGVCKVEIEANIYLSDREIEKLAIQKLASELELDYYN